jgi:iron(III) transport system ATP-binding protein
MTQSVFLDLRQVRKSFGSFTALESIDLSIPQGELICFLGPSGCGKTTLLRVIAGLEVQTAGQVFQAGKDISLLPPAQRDYGIVFQSYALFPNLSVADNVAYGLVNRKVSKEHVQQRVKDLVKLVGLPGSEAKFPSQLSGGQQQRIALARALATSPSLLLLDEPLSALDALERVRLRGEIRSLQQQLGVTTIMVTHDQEEALSIADRIVVMNHGRIEQVGTPSEIYRQPASPFVADFVGKANALPAQLVGDTIHCGSLQLRAPARAQVRATKAEATQADGSTAVKMYLRPEDFILIPQAKEASEQAPLSENEFLGTLQKIEFLGSFCHAHITSVQLPSQLLVYFSLNTLSENQLEIGSTVRLKLLAERIKVF